MAPNQCSCPAGFSGSRCHKGNKILMCAARQVSLTGPCDTYRIIYTAKTIFVLLVIKCHEQTTGRNDYKCYCPLFGGLKYLISTFRITVICILRRNTVNVVATMFGVVMSYIDKVRNEG